MRGSVRKPRTDGGTWSYRLDLGFDYVGKRRQRGSAASPRRRKHRPRVDDALSGVQRGTFVAPSRTTVRDFLELWLDGVKTDVALTAWVSYRQESHLRQPVSSVRVPKGTTPEQRVWTAAEARQFLDALADDRLVALWTLALHTGMRRGELAGLR